MGNQVMTGSMFARSCAVAAVCAASVVPLATSSPAVATAPPAERTAPVVSVTSPSYDAPGGTVMTVTTVRGIPAGYTAALTAQVGSWPTSCDPFKWTHG